MSDRPAGRPADTSAVLAPDDASALRALAAKYRELLVLRRARERGEPPPAKEVFRKLAAAHPGALYELDTLSVDALEGRADALERAVAGQITVEPWMRWMTRFHRLVHEELGARRRRGPGASAGPRSRATALAIARIAEEESVAIQEVASALFSRPRRGL